MPSHKLDLHQGTSLTRGVQSRAQDRATRAGIVVDLTMGSRAKLNEAIEELQSELASNHPDDSSLPPATVHVRDYQAADKALVSIRYRHPTTRVDLSRTAVSQASRRVGTQSVEWWLDNTSVDIYGLPNGELIYRPSRSGEPIPRSYSHVVGVQTIELPTILDDHPDTGHLYKVGKVNSANDSQFFEVGGAPAGSLYFHGWDSTDLPDGRKLVVYRASYMNERWPYMVPPEWDPDNEIWSVIVLDAYERVSFGTFPVHTPT